MKNYVSFIRPRRLRLRAIAAMLLLVLPPIAISQASTPIDNGYLDFSYGSTISPEPTGEKPESKLWFNDGFWWGSLYNAVAGEYHIYRLNFATQDWEDTGLAIDDREDSRADALWDQASQKLYIASHVKVTNSSRVNDPMNWGRLYRYSYNTTTNSYTRDDLDAAQAVDYVTVNQDKTETLVIDKDSTGRLWVTYVSRVPNSDPAAPMLYQVYVNSTTGTGLSSDDNWGTPFILPGSLPVAQDDISSLVAFRDSTGPKVGVIWSNQVDGKIHFAVHADSSAPSANWPITDMPVPASEDHVALRSLQKTSSGQVFAAIKTNNVGPGEPLIGMVARDTNGALSFHQFSPFESSDTRPTLVVDEGNLANTGDDQVLLFVSSKPSGGRICYKAAAITTPLSSMAFPQPTEGCRDSGTTGAIPFIADDVYTTIDNATTTKQTVNSSTGLVVLASDDAQKVYVHGVMGQPVDPTPVLPTVQFAAATSSIDEKNGTATISVSLSAAAAAPVTVDYATSNGTAKDGLDYVAISGKLTFAAGETSKSFTVQIKDDALAEPTETVTLSLSNATNATLGSPSTATLAIVDSDSFKLYLPMVVK